MRGRIIQQFICITPDNEVAIKEQDMNTGEIRLIPLVVKDGKVYAAKDGDGE